MLGDDYDCVNVGLAELVKRGTAIGNLVLLCIPLQLFFIQVAQDDLLHFRVVLEKRDETLGKRTNPAYTNRYSHVNYPLLLLRDS